MDTRDRVWRGGHGDVTAVRVLRSSATMINGQLRDGCFETEVQAWAGVMSAAQEDVDSAVACHQRLIAETHHAGQELVARRVSCHKATGAYSEWRRAQAAKIGTAV